MSTPAQNGNTNLDVEAQHLMQQPTKGVFVGIVVVSAIALGSAVGIPTHHPDLGLQAGAIVIALGQPMAQVFYTF